MSDITANVTNELITVSVSGDDISASVSGGIGPSGPSGVLTVSAPITNTGTSSAAVIGLSVGTGLEVSAGSLRASVGAGSTNVCAGNDSRLSDSREWSADTVSQAEAEAGTATTRRAYTALRVFQAIAAWWAGSAAKTKLDGISTGATANATDAQLRDRSTHTGSQAISTVTGLQTAIDAKAPIASPTFTGTVSGVTKSMVGLGNVDNTSDANKPISTATQTALDSKAPKVSPQFTTSVTTNSTTFDAFNTTATTVNAFGAATQINVGTTNGNDFSSFNVNTHYLRANNNFAVGPDEGCLIYSNGMIECQSLYTSGTVTIGGSLVFSAGGTTFSGTGISTYGRVTASSFKSEGSGESSGRETLISAGAAALGGKLLTLNNVIIDGSIQPSDTLANGGGIRLAGGSGTFGGVNYKNLTWVNATQAWTSDQDFNLVAGKVYEINGATVLSSTALGPSVVGSSLTSVGTIGTGTWQGTAVGVAYGGTGATTAAGARANLDAASSTHTHGNITNAGAIGTTSGQIVVTTTGGVLTTAATISSSQVSGLGTLATQSSVSYESLTNVPSTFAPTAHKSSHATGGSDALSPSDIGAATALHTHGATDITSGTLDAARLPATAVTAGSYGSASSVGTFTVDAAGRLTAAGSTSIALAGSAITSGTVALARLPVTVEQSAAIGNSGTSTTLSLSSASVQTVTLSGNCTFTMPSATAGASLTLILTQSGTFTASFTNVLWSGGTAPTITATANKRDILVFVSDGTNWYGTASQNH